MALRVWLPLTGTLKNNGLSKVTATVNGGSTSYTDGKIGQCLSCNGSTYWVVSGITLGAEASICCWTKTSTNKKMSWVLNANVYAHLNLYESSFYTLNMGDANDNPFVDDSGSNISVLHDELWHHFAVTFDGTSAKLYIDGVYRGKAKTYRSPATPTNSYIKLGGGFSNGHSYDWNGGLNDFRVYDHCLSPKEVREVSKALIGHWKLDDVTDNIIYDCSGYGSNGTKIGTLTPNSDSPRYKTCTLFGTGNNAIACGRNMFVRDAITISCWAYMDNWSSFNTRLLSCTESGGWNFEPSSGKMAVEVGTGQSSMTYKGTLSNTSLSELTSGWHHFVGTYDGFSTKIYIDGVLEGTKAAYTTKTPIFYNANNGLFIGAEAAGNQTSPAGGYFKGKMSDVRIYATALSEEDILELYNTSAFITDNGRFECYELNETEGDSNITQTGLIESDCFYEEYLDVEQAKIGDDYVTSNEFIEI